MGSRVPGAEVEDIGGLIFYNPTPRSWAGRQDRMTGRGDARFMERPLFPMRWLVRQNASAASIRGFTAPLALLFAGHADRRGRSGG